MEEQPEPAGASARQRIGAAATLVVGAVVLSWALRIVPGDPLFYPATLALAAVWIAGAYLSGPIHLGRAVTRSGGPRTLPLVQSFALGLLLLGIFLAGALVVSRVPLLRDPVLELLDHARLGSLPAVLAITALNGISEELYFRGALFAAIPDRIAVPATTLVYALVTATAAIPLLTLAAVAVGLVTALHRRVTGGVLGPIVTHLTWSIGMLLALGPLLNAGV